MNKEQQLRAAQERVKALEKELTELQIKSRQMADIQERSQLRQFRAMFVPMAIDALKAKGEPITMDGIKAWTEEILAYIKAE